MMNTRIPSRSRWRLPLVAALALLVVSGGAWAKLVGGVQAMKVRGEDALEMKLAVDAPAKVRIVVGTNGITFDLRAAPGQTPSKDNPIELVTGKLRISGTEVQVFENDKLVCRFPVAAIPEGAFKRFCYDERPPIVTVTPSPGPNAYGWNNTNVTVTVRAEDEPDGSGIKLLRYKVGTSSPVDVPTAQLFLSEGGRIGRFTLELRDEGIHRLTFWAQDEAGNLSTAATSEVRIDRTGPTIAGTPSPSPNARGWNNTNVIVRFTCSDAHSGIDVCPKDEELKTEGKDQSITREAVDKAGNRTPATVGGISIDKTPPGVELSLSPSAVRPGEPITITVRATDALSGVDSVIARDSGLGAVSLRADREQWGGTISPALDGTVTVTVTDRAGNTASRHERYAMIRPAFFAVVAVRVSPPDPVVGQAVVVQATVQNTGHEPGAKSVTLCLDGVCREEEGRIGGRRFLQGHKDSVESVAFRNRGDLVASGSADRTIKLWNVATGQEVATLKGHTGWVVSVAFSPDGRTLASGGGDRTVRLWNTETGQEIHRLDGHWGWVFTVAFSPDGRTMASGSEDQTICLWDTSTGVRKARLEGHESDVCGVAFSPRGDLLASGSVDRTVKLWDPASGRVKATLRGHQGYVLSVAFSPDGRLVASGSEDRTVRVWDVTTGAETHRLQGHRGIVYSVAFSPDGKKLASASEDGTIKLWDVTTGKEIRALHGHYEYVSSVAFSPAGRYVASGSADNTVILWEVAAPGILVELEPDQSQTVEFPLPPFGSPGSHAVEVRTPDHSLGPVSFRVDEPANLVISDLKLSPSQLCGSGYIKVDATVSNRGGRESEDRVRFFINDREHAHVTVRLRPGGSQTVSFSHYMSSPGWYSIRVSSRDHGASGTARVDTPVHFSVGSLSFSTSYPCPGESVTIRATITNSGCSSGSQSIELYVDGSYRSSRSISLAPGDQAQVEFSTSFGSERSYRVEIRSENASSSGTISPRRRVYFEVSNISFSPGRPREGQQVTVSATVTNKGCESATQYIRFFVGGSEQRSEGVYLGSGSSAPVSFTYTFWRRGTYSVRVESDDTKPERSITVDPGH